MQIYNIFTEKHKKVRASHDARTIDRSEVYLLCDDRTFGYVCLFLGEDTLCKVWSLKYFFIYC